MRYFLIAITLAFVLIGCSSEPNSGYTGVAPQNQRTATHTPTATATPTVTPTPEPTATPTPPPTLAPPSNPQVSSAGAVPSDIHSVIARYNWPVQQAIDVAWCESRWDTMAYNSSSAVGLFQIIGGNPAMFDLETNVAAAYTKYLDGVRIGNPWYHWNNFGSCGHF